MSRHRVNHVSSMLFVAGGLLMYCAPKPAEPPPSNAVVAAPAASANEADEPRAATPAPSAAEDAGPPPAPAGNDEPVGIPSCDEYLAAYKRCEPKLAGEIAAGNRRSYAAERAAILFFKKGNSASALPDACRSYLHELVAVCP